MRWSCTGSSESDELISVREKSHYGDMLPPPIVFLFVVPLYIYNQLFIMRLVRISIGWRSHRRTLTISKEDLLFSKTKKNKMIWSLHLVLNHVDKGKRIRMTKSKKMSIRESGSDRKDKMYMYLQYDSLLLSLMKFFICRAK